MILPLASSLITLLCCLFSVCAKNLPSISHPTMTDLLKHLNEVHATNLQYEYKSFDTDSEFSDWLRDIENQTPCRFVRKMTSNLAKNTYYYSCSRSGLPRSTKKPSKDRKRLTKVQGTSKIARTCPANLIKFRKNDGRIHVKYQLETFMSHGQVGATRSYPSSSRGSQITGR